MSGFILTLNAGSSSLKVALYPVEPGHAPVLTGQVERIGTSPRLVARWDGEAKTSRDLAVSGDGHRAALNAILEIITERLPGLKIDAVSHRIVHGGPDRERSVVLTEGVLSDLERLCPFAPLHQPHNLSGVRAASVTFPDALQIGCFDTAFHRGHPWVNDTFALPREYYDRGVRRYGFHGLSYDYIAQELSRSHPELHAGRVVVAHLGNGASMCALHGGRSIASTMGFTALDGLPMGTRTGQLDPGVVLYLLSEEGMKVEEVTELLYRRSGLLGLSGLSHDMRTLEASDAPEARDAIDYFVFRVRRELGALAAALGGLDAVVFTGGIGENSASVRRRVCEGMEWIGIRVDPQANLANASRIGTADSAVRVLVIPTDEERVLAREARSLLNV